MQRHPVVDYDSNDHRSTVRSYSMVENAHRRPAGHNQICHQYISCSYTAGALAMYLFSFAEPVSTKAMAGAD